MDRLEARFSDAVRQHQAGQLDAAAAAYREILAAQPQHAHARHYLGLIAFVRGDLDAAERDIAAAIAVMPQLAEFHVNYGNVRKRQGDLAAAEAAYRQALALRPVFPQATYSLALVLEARGDDAAAATVYRQLTAASPLAEAHTALGRIALRQNDATTAEREFTAGAQRAAPPAVEPLLALAHFLCDRQRAREALPWLRQAVNWAPESARVRVQYGVALDGIGRHTDAERELRQALALIERGIDAPVAAAVWANLGNTLRSQGRTAEGVDACRRALATDGATPDMHSNLLFQLLMVPQSPAGLYAEHRAYAQRWTVAHPRPARRPADDGRLRIGIVSADLRRHPVGYFMRGLLAHLDRDRYAVWCYHTGWNEDALSEAIRQSATAWRACRDVDDGRLFEQIRADGIDILIDLSGHTGDNRLPLFSRRPAPVQLTYLGYPCSTGLDAIDFRLTDAVCDPPEVAEACHSERLLRLPDSYYCYSPPADAPPVSPLPALRRGHLTFGAFLQLAKLSPETMALWARVLTALPGAQLKLHAASFGDVPTARRVTAAFERLGVSRKRLTLVGWQAYPTHFAGYAGIDIALDTQPFNLATNTCEALWMGVPTLTLRGDNGPGRMGASLLRAAGLPAFIADDAEQFVALASAWNLRYEELSALRAGLRGQVQQSALMDAPRFAANFSRLIDAAWQATRPA